MISAQPCTDLKEIEASAIFYDVIGIDEGQFVSQRFASQLLMNKISSQILCHSVINLPTSERQ